MPDLFPANTGAATAAEEAETAEVVEVDLDAVIKTEHPDADLNAAIPQPPAGVYTLRLKLSDRGEEANPAPKITQKKQPYVNVNFDITIEQDGSEWNGFQITDFDSCRASSLVFQKRGTSKLAHIMNCVGATLPEEASVRKMLELVTEAFAGEGALIQGEIEWKASRKKGDGKYDWEDVATKMRDFPKDPEGDGHLQVFTWHDPKNPKITRECRANAYVSRFLLN